jgi:transposase
VTATAIVAELGDARRFGCSDDAVRHCGLDVTVHQSDRKRAPGHLSHEGPELLRWALFEAAQQACRSASPDYEYYRQVARRIDHNRACYPSRASFADAPTTSSASSATRRSLRSRRRIARR